MSLPSFVLLLSVAVSQVAANGSELAKKCNVGDDISLMQTTLKVSEGTAPKAVAQPGQKNQASLISQIPFKAAPSEVSHQINEAISNSDVESESVTVAMKCICALVVAYFLVYVLVILLRTHNQIASTKSTDEIVRVSATLERTAKTAGVGVPMLGIVLLGTQLLSEELATAGGHNATFYGLPSWWTKCSMVLSVIAVGLGMVSSVIMLLAKRIPMMYQFFGVLYAVGMGLQPVAACIVLAGCAALERPYDVWLRNLGPDGTPSAVTCVIILAAQYFAIMFLWRVSQQWWADSSFLTALRAAAAPQEIAPMLGVLFLAVRMRAVEVSDARQPQAWVQVTFFIVTTTLLMQSLFALMCSSCTTPPDSEDAVHPRIAEEHTRTAEFFYKWAMILLEAVICIGIIVIIISTFFIEAGKDHHTPELSPTLAVIIILSIMFFGVHLMSFAARMSATQSKTAGVSQMVELFETAKESVSFIPMICVLFTGTRLRALQLSLGIGSPQTWVQAMMWVSVAALVIQVALVFLSNFLTGRSSEPPGGNRYDWATQQEQLSRDAGSKNLRFFLVTCQYVSLLFLLGAVIAVVCGMFMLNRHDVVKN